MLLLVGTRKGGFVLRGDAKRKTWETTRNIMIGSTIHHIVMDPRDKKTILMTERGGHLGPTIHRSTDFGKTWQEATKPPAFAPAANGEAGRVIQHDFWLSPGHANEPGVWYLGTSPQGLFRSEDGGATWGEVTGLHQHPMFNAWAGPPEYAPPGGATLHSILIDPRDAQHLYISMSGGGVFESSDRGANWQPLNKGILSDFMPVPDAEYGHDAHATRMNVLDPDRLYQQNHCGVYTMDRKEGLWVRIGDKLPKDISDHGFPIVTHPRDPKTAWIFPNEAFPYARVPHDGKPATFVTHNAGKTWRRQSKGLPTANGWYTIKRQAMNSDTRDPLGLYFGTTGGEIWASHDEGESWTRIADGLPEIFSVEVAEL
ncbi:MAG: glycosyl hydrolase [Chloroflexi bacterium]|nr:glycosyl hydrolase [Chloroflexota bacterium]